MNIWFDFLWKNIRRKYQHYFCKFFLWFEITFLNFKFSPNSAHSYFVQLLTVQNCINNVRDWEHSSFLFEKKIKTRSTSSIREPQDYTSGTPNQVVIPIVAGMKKNISNSSRFIKKKRIYPSTPMFCVFVK